MHDISYFTNRRKILMLALDHRDSFEKLTGTKDKEKLIEVKYDIISALYDLFSGILLDPLYGLPAYQQYIREQKLKNPKPFLLCVEKSGYSVVDGERVTELEYDVEKLKDMGASGVKLLLYFNTHAKSAENQSQLAKMVIEQSHRLNLPVFLEIVTYQPPNTPYSKGEEIINSLRFFQKRSIVPDVYKLEYPDSEEHCKTISSLFPQTPWILLTRGGNYEVFRDNLHKAVKNGASGFLAGRSIWQECAILDKGKRTECLQTASRRRFAEIVSLA